MDGSISKKEENFSVIVAGGRDFNDFGLMCKYLDYYLKNKQNITILCGMAKGADYYGELYAKSRDIKVKYFPADWDKHGKAAGAIRNSEMAQQADALVAFWDGESRGTKDMINKAQKKGLLVKIVKY